MNFALGGHADLLLISDGIGRLSRERAVALVRVSGTDGGAESPVIRAWIKLED